MARQFLLALVVFCALKTFNAQGPINPLAASEAAITQLNNKLALASSQIGMGIGATSKFNFKTIANLRYQTKLQMKPLTNAAKTNTNPAQQSCVDEANLASTNIQNQLFGLQRCGVTDIYAAKGFQRQLTLLKTRSSNILTDCQALYPDEAAQLAEIEACVEAEIAAIEAEIANAKGPAGGSGCVQDTQEKINLALSEAQENYRTCVSPPVVA